MKSEIHRYYSGSDVRRLKDQSHIMFEEVSDGIYRVLKDRFDELPTYVSSIEIPKHLNSSRKVAVSHAGLGSGFANFDCWRR